VKALSSRTLGLHQSGIRAITRLVNEVGGINLGQGICDMPVPDPIKEGAQRAIVDDRSIYTPFEGIPALREQILEKVRSFNHLPGTSVDEVMVGAGSTGAFSMAMLALLDPGDQVLLFEPFYGYHRNLIQALGGQTVCAPLQPPGWEVDFQRVEACIGPRTKMILLNTPANPTGKVWDRAEMILLLDLAEKYDLYVVTDEIYEYMVYDGRRHLSFASLDGAYERTVTISGFSKTYNMTGWRLGYAVGPRHIIEKMGLLSDMLYICAPAPLQYGILEAFEMPESYFDELEDAYSRKRVLMCDTLQEAGFEFERPQGSYYVFARFDGPKSPLRDCADDMAACEHLVHEAGVATIPGRAFFGDPHHGSRYLRFCFAKEFPVLREACHRIKTSLTA
jgi:aminotransferase